MGNVESFEKCTDVNGVVDERGQRGDAARSRVREGPDAKLLARHPSVFLVPSLSAAEAGLVVAVWTGHSEGRWSLRIRFWQVVTGTALFNT